MAQLKTRLVELISMQQVREKRKLSYVDIAEASGVHVNTIRNWVHGKVERRDDQVIMALCRYFDCEVGDLLYIDHEETA